MFRSAVTSRQVPALRRKPLPVLLEFRDEPSHPVRVVTVEANEKEIRLTIPTDGMPSEEVGRFVDWVRGEVTARRSKLTDALAAQLAEEINADWWEKNKARFESPDGE